MNKKLLWIIIGLVVVVILLVVLKKSGALGKEEGMKVSTEKVSNRTIIETVTASGKIYPEVEVKVSPDISGEIVDLVVQEGDSVRKGQVLARIYADIYSNQKDQAAAMVSQQQAQVQNSTAQLDALKSALDQAQITYDRQKKLMNDKVISKSEFEQAETTLRSAQANYNAAVQGIKSNQASVQSALANLNKANADLGRATIVAPMSGVISLLSVKKGERVAGNSFNVGTEMMRVADMSTMEIRVDVGENDVPKVHLYDSALVEVDAYNNRKFKGIVTQIASSSKGTVGQTGVSNDVTNYEVRIRLLPDSYKDLIDPKKPKSFPFRPGMNASADIQTKRHENVLSVPINAVTTREKGSDKSVNSEKSSFDNNNNNSNNASGDESSKSSATDLEEVVYVVGADKKVKKVVVKTDVQDINYIEITSGLKKDDEVVTGPYSTVSKLLKDGTLVKVVPKDQLFDKK
ncbi:MAG TPA: efflux RND transporter periplasmic adaptor subunit [Chitinophagaceae bacterium]|nr:efflux RND transporter periplasmic adaptor subunit [Chitinophagaceae bacterium]